MSKIWLTVDGGGTKTEFCACNEAGTVVFNELFGNANYKASSREDVLKNLEEGFSALTAATGKTPAEIEGMVVGLSGCDSEADRRIYLELLRSLGTELSRVYLCNDTELIFRALSDRDGICAVAGTGSIACSYGRNGPVGRIGGWGAPLSDLGSGYWVGAKALSDHIRVLDGELTIESALTDILRSRISGENGDVQSRIAVLSVQEVAALAKDIFDLAEQGDRYCKEIMDASAAHLARLIVRLAEKSGFAGEITVVASGGMFRNDMYFASVREKVLTQLGSCSVRFLRPSASPAIDGLTFARQYFSGI